MMTARKARQAALAYIGSYDRDVAVASREVYAYLGQDLIATIYAGISSDRRDAEQITRDMRMATPKSVLAG